MTISHAEIITGLQSIGLNNNSHVLVHSSLAALGDVDGGAQTVLESMLAIVGTLIMPAFTYQTMVWPPNGPADNGVDYAAIDYQSINDAAVFFTSDLPAHPNVGEIAEAFRRMPDVKRSSHPVLSFTALGEDDTTILAAQTIDQPFGPIEWLRNHGGDVVLIGVDHTQNISLHYAEHLAGRKQFLRWALTKIGGRGTAIELPNFPGKSDGFNAIETEIKPMTRWVKVGPAVIKRIPLELLIPVAVGLIDEEPKALL